MSFDDLARGLAQPLPRRRVLQLAGSALLAGASAGLRPERARAASSGEWAINVIATDACGGCTSGNTTKCFGRNACVDAAGANKCIKEQIRDCCSMLIRERTCCSGCPEDECLPNVPCALGGAGATIVSDTCPPVSDVSSDCQYYARMERCSKGKCKYFRTGIEKCTEPPFTIRGASKAKLRCIRECLQTSDANLPPAARTADGCSKRDPVTAYHNACFTHCGVSEWLFPDEWWIFAPDDGN